VFNVHYFAYYQYEYINTLCSGMGFLCILLPDPQMSDSMLISCDMDKKFVHFQNVFVDQVSREYYINYLMHIGVPQLLY
jgi:hypothetical protein